ncbi:hypothetical protein [Bosea sp. MMO-172]|uniref:hypothetical protein n=1 Tax=Bosea sp. MMO-172 TaxID=3127885 RepID=UPI003017F83B
MSEDTDDNVSQAYEAVAWRGLMLALLAQVMVPAPNDEEECAQFLATVLSDIIDQTVNSEAMPEELDRDALRAELDAVNESIKADLAQARLDREKLRATYLRPSH